MATKAVRVTGQGPYQLSPLSTVKTLGDLTGGIPSTAQVALLQAESQDVRWTADGSTPTASLGMLLKANDSMMYDWPLSDLKFIESASGAKLNVTFFGSP